MLKDKTKSYLIDTIKLLFAKAERKKEIKRSTIKEPYIVAADDQFLGIISTKKSESDSIFNEYGIYGSKYSGLSISNENGTYGSNESVYSAYNELTSTPPKIMMKTKPVAFLTKNKQITNCIDPDNLINEVTKRKRINWQSLLK